MSIDLLVRCRNQFMVLKGQGIGWAEINQLISELDAEIKKSGKLSYDEWMVKVDTLLLSHHDDMPDWNWRDAYDDEMSPEEAVSEYKEENL